LVLLALVAVPAPAMGVQLTLYWADNSSNESGFRVERKTGSGGTYAEIAVVAANITSYTNYNLASSTTYCYRLRAYNSSGVSPYSNESCVTTGQSTLNLTVAKSGTGSGTVSSSPGGINCGSDCTEAFLSGTVVTLAAAASTGSRFDGWSGGGCAGTGTCTLSGNSSLTVTATFTSASTTSTTYRASTDFSLVQGYRGWSYRDSTGAALTPDAAAGRWVGAESYLWLWPGGGHPGSLRDVVRRWTAPQNGTARITGKAWDQDPGCGDGVVALIRHAGTEIWRATIANGNTTGVAFGLTRTIRQGEVLDFVINRGGNNYCDSTAFDPTITLSP
jgi:hypothetical protein